MSKTDKEILFSGLALVGLVQKYGAGDFEFLVRTSTELGKDMARHFPDTTKDLHE